MAKILIVEDEGIVAKSIESKLHMMGHDVSAIIKSAEEVSNQVITNRPDLVLMDINLQGEKDGIDAAQELNEKHQIPVVYLTAFFDEDTLDRAKLTQPYGFIVKPFGPADLRANITMALFKHRSEMEAKKNNDTLLTGLKRIHEGLIITDHLGNVLHMNDMAEKLTGWSQSEALGKQTPNIVRLKSCDDQSLIENPIRMVIRNREPVMCEECLFLMARDDSKTIVKVEAIPVEDEHGDIIGVVCVLRGSPETVALDEKTDKLVKNEFKKTKGIFDEIKSTVDLQLEQLSSVNEKIHSPIGALTVYTQLLNCLYSQNDNKPCKEILASGNNLLAIISDVLDILKIEAEQLELENEKFNLDYLINEIALYLHPKVRAKDLKLTNKVDDNVPQVLVGDKRLIKQILINLLDNAIKFTNNGKVGLIIQNKEVSATASPVDIDLHFTVYDTGIGIAKDKQKVIFDSFVQGDSSFAKQYGGVGLGLTLAKAYVEVLGGKISVVSDEGKGSQFHFEIPLMV